MTSGPAAGRTIRMLFFPCERFPTYRVDVDVLFGHELLSRGHAIDFVMQAADEKVPTGRQTWNGRTVWIGPNDTKGGIVHRLRKHGLSLLHDFRSLKLVRARDYDALQIKDKFLIAAVGVLWARLRGVQFFYWLSFPLPEGWLLRARNGTARYPLPTLIRGHLSSWLLYSWILPRATHVFVQSERMKQDVSAMGIDAAKMTAVPMGIRLKDFDRRPAGWKAARGAGPFVVAYLGTLEAERRIDTLIEMLALLIRAGLPVKLLLVGDAGNPAEREALKAQARKLGVEQHLEITGFLPRPDALRRMNEADVALAAMHPSPLLLSTSPTKLVEYLALGLPVIANDHPEQRLILRESRAGVRVPWSARHFARAVRWMLALSEAERDDMGRRGRAWVETHRTYEHIAHALEKTYLSLLRPGRS